MIRLSRIIIIVAISGTMAGCCALPDTPGPVGIPGC